MRKATILSFLIACLIAPMAAHAQSVFSDTYVIPVVSHAQGVNALYASDVIITNFQPTPLTVQLVFIQAGEGNSDNVFPLTTPAIPAGVVTVQPNTTIVLKDILNGYSGQSNVSGALLLGGSAPFAVTSRSYVITANGAALSETIPASRDFLDNSTGKSDNTQVAIIPGIVNNVQSRTNIGLVIGAGSAGGQTVGVQITIKDAGGNVLGTKLVTVAPGNFTQLQFAVASITNKFFDLGSAEIRIVQGFASVLPYASVVDNATGTGTAYIMGQFPPSTPFTSRGIVSSVFTNLLSAMSRGNYNLRY